MACLSSHLRRTHLIRSLGALGVLCLAGCPAASPYLVTGEPGPVFGAAACEHAKDDPRCRPESTHERVELTHHLAGCEPGPRGRATFTLGDEVLAELAPGDHKSVRLPRGDVSVGVKVEPLDTVELHALSLGGAGPVPLEVGCAAANFVTSGLAPLVLRGPQAPCPSVRVRASGLDFELRPGLTWTLLVPHGEHVVRFDGASQAVAVGVNGAELVVPACGLEGSRPRSTVVAQPGGLR